MSAPTPALTPAQDPAPIGRPRGLGKPKATPPIVAARPRALAVTLLLPHQRNPVGRTARYNAAIAQLGPAPALAARVRPRLATMATARPTTAAIAATHRSALTIRP